MNNKYRDNFVNSIEEDINQDKYIDPERIAKGIQYLDEAQAILRRQAKRIINKHKKELEAANKDVDAELAANGILVTEEELSAVE